MDEQLDTADGSIPILCACRHCQAELTRDIDVIHRFWASTEPIIIRRGDTVTLRTSAAELMRRRIEHERDHQ